MDTFHVGDYVRWRDEEAIGRVKEVGKRVALVVFQANGYMDSPLFTRYTGEACDLEDLSLVKRGGQ